MANEREFPSISEATHAARVAFLDLRDADRPALLRDIARAADQARARIIATCAQETALTPDELAPEFDRMVGTLRMLADLVEEGSWVRAAIDTRAEPPAAPVGPNHDLRSMLLPLGPVAVFGASNFPLAYGVLGGDTASALAAGCPVVVKEHPAHPRTGRLLVEIATEATRRHESPGATWISYVADPGVDNNVGTALVRELNIKGVGFTGSLGGGMTLDKLARERRRPIPVFAEMGSANRVIVCAQALKGRGREIALELAASILSRNGQQCTKPGLIFLEHDPVAGPAFVAELARALDAAPPRRMLSGRIIDEYVKRCSSILSTPDVALATSRDQPEVREGGERRAVPMLFAALDHDNFRDDLEHFSMEMPITELSHLTDEVFGPAAIVFGAGGYENVIYADPALVTAIYADPEDLADLGWRLSLPLGSTGRVTINTVTTGVRVATAMVHGGPFPGSNRPDTTAVGPRAIERWCRAVCFQNCPDELLPRELQNANPRGILRTVDGIPTRDRLPSP